MWHREDCFVRNQNLLSVEVDGELVMISENQTHFISLNAVGKIIYDTLIEPKSMAELVQVVCTHFEVTEVQCEADLGPFINELMSQKVVQIVARKERSGLREI